MTTQTVTLTDTIIIVFIVLSPHGNYKLQNSGWMRMMPMQTKGHRSTLRGLLAT
jgi:hypothetical protein